MQHPYTRGITSHDVRLLIIHLTDLTIMLDYLHTNISIMQIQLLYLYNHYQFIISYQSRSNHSTIFQESQVNSRRIHSQNQLID